MFILLLVNLLSESVSRALAVRQEQSIPLLPRESQIQNAESAGESVAVAPRPSPLRHPNCRSFCVPAETARNEACKNFYSMSPLAGIQGLRISDSVFS